MHDWVMFIQNICMLLKELANIYFTSLFMSVFFVEGIIMLMVCLEFKFKLRWHFLCLSLIFNINQKYPFTLISPLSCRSWSSCPLVPLPLSLLSFYLNVFLIKVFFVGFLGFPEFIVFDNISTSLLYPCAQSWLLPCWVLSRWVWFCF
jgi:hypothetical protein